MKLPGSALRCSGCYAYENGHVGDGLNLRQLADKKGKELVQSVLEAVDEYRPLHLSIVGGDPLVRFREPRISKPSVQIKAAAAGFNFGNYGDFGNPRRVTACSIRQSRWRR